MLSEGAASLLPDQLRPAVFWRIELDVNGEVRSVDVRRARVRSRAQLDYVGVQRDLEQGSLPDALVALRDVGERRQALARQRHAINLDLPAQEVEHDGSTWRLAIREPLAVEDYNAEISLPTGMCAADVMLGIGTASCARSPHRIRARYARCVAQHTRSASHGRTARRPEMFLPDSIVPTRIMSR